MAARNKIYNKALQAKRTAKLTASYASHLPTAEKGDQFDAEKTIAEFYRHLYECIEKLPSPAKEIFLASLLGSKSKKDIAQALDVCEKTVYNEKRKAIKILRQGLLNSGLDVSSILITYLISVLSYFSWILRK